MVVVVRAEVDREGQLCRLTDPVQLAGPLQCLVEGQVAPAVRVLIQSGRTRPSGERVAVPSPERDVCEAVDGLACAPCGQRVRVGEGQSSLVHEHVADVLGPLGRLGRDLDPYRVPVAGIGAVRQASGHRGPAVRCRGAGPGPRPPTLRGRRPPCRRGCHPATGPLASGAPCAAPARPARRTRPDGSDPRCPPALRRSGRNGCRRRTARGRPPGPSPDRQLDGSAPKI